MSQETQQQQGENNDSSKVINAYNANLKKLTAIVGGEKNIKSKIKVPKDEVGDLISELFKEETTAAKEKLKADVKNLIKAKVTFDRAIQEEEQKLKKLKEEKMKEFNKASQDVFAQIEGLGELEKSYYDSLTEASQQAQ